MTLVLEQLGVRFGDRAALDAVSWSFRAGRITVVLGPNAAGKSTLLRCLVGAQRPTSGRVLLDDQPVHRLSPRAVAQRVAYVSQRPTALAGFTVREVVGFGCYARATARNRIDAALERLELTEHAARPMHELSVGQQQRVSLARAIAQLNNEGMLVLDEPTSSMDLRHARRVSQLLRELTHGGATVIVALHDLVAASSLADEALLFDAGRLIVSGTAEEVLEPGRLEAVYGVPFVETVSTGGRRTIVPDNSAADDSR